MRDLHFRKVTEKLIETDQVKWPPRCPSNIFIPLFPLFFPLSNLFPLLIPLLINRLAIVGAKITNQNSRVLSNSLRMIRNLRNLLVFQAQSKGKSTNKIYLSSLKCVVGGKPTRNCISFITNRFINEFHDFFHHPRCFSCLQFIFIPKPLSPAPHLPQDAPLESEIQL